MLSTHLKGDPSIQLHRDLDITQKSAWHEAHRNRQTWDWGERLLGCPFEVDEAYMGGKRENMPNHLHEELTSLGLIGKTAVVVAKHCEPNRGAVEAVKSTGEEAVQGLVRDCVEPQTTVYSDDERYYETPPFEHQCVKHSVREYLHDKAHANGLEPFLSMLKRGYGGTCHKMSPKHPQRYANEFPARHNAPIATTPDQMEPSMLRMVGKRLRHKDLNGANSLDSGARGMAI